jgi:hypothetical protein
MIPTYLYERKRRFREPRFVSDSQAVVPQVHNGLEQLSLRPSAGQSMSVVAPGVVPYFGRFSRAACPGLCRCSQPSLGDGGIIGRPRGQTVSPEDGRQTWREKEPSPNPGSGKSRRGSLGSSMSRLESLTGSQHTSKRGAPHATADTRSTLPGFLFECSLRRGSSISRPADQQAQDSAKDSLFAGHGIAVVLAFALRSRPTTATTGTSGFCEEHR